MPRLAPKGWPECPKEIHGYPVIEAAPSNRGRFSEGTREGWVVVLKREHAFHPYVTAAWFAPDEEWTWGHYFATLVEAAKDWEERVARGG